MYRIGIFNGARVARSGGGFQYIMTLIDGLKEIPNLEVVVFYDDPAFCNYCFESPRFQWVQIDRNESWVSKMIRGAFSVIGVRSPVLGRFKALLDYPIDILITYHSLIGFHLGIPFLNFIGDVMYKYYPQLPEYTFAHRWIRDLTARRSTKHAEFTIVDSVESKNDLVKFFNVPSSKLRPVHLCAPPHTYKNPAGMGANGRALIAKHNLPVRFIFYPAQFWGHKNHANLVRALDLVRRKHGMEIPAVFAGSAWESFESVQNILKELKMERQVRCLGYLPDDEIVALYKAADALVFASFADYTSIPLVEAMALGTPIICSNVFSLPEQVGDAGVFFDPFNIEEIADAVYRVWSNGELRQELAAKGLARSKNFTPERFARQWHDVITEALDRRKS